MTTKKMSLANIQGKLSRSELKNIMAGSGNEAAGTCLKACLSCTSKIYISSCTSSWGPPWGANYYFDSDIEKC